jgi:hypothetical protein
MALGISHMKHSQSHDTHVVWLVVSNIYVPFHKKGMSSETHWLILHHFSRLLKPPTSIGFQIFQILLGDLPLPTYINHRIFLNQYMKPMYSQFLVPMVSETPVKDSSSGPWIWQDGAPRNRAISER